MAVCDRHVEIVEVIDEIDDRVKVFGTARYIDINATRKFNFKG